MRISDVDLYRYELPLTSPLHLTGHPMRTRCGLLIRVAAPGGAVGWGDAAPLPGFSEETLDEASSALRRVQSLLRGVTFAATGRDGAWTEVELPRDVPSSVRFAVESALVGLGADLTGHSIPRMLTDAPRRSVSLNALVEASDDVEPDAKRVRDAGYRAVKLKVGRDDPTVEAVGVRVLHDVLGPGVAIRLDANRRWSVEEAVAFAEDTGRVPIEYVEEPIADPTPDRLRRLADQTGLPLALDETTRAIRPSELRSYRFVRAIILKPTLVGGVSGTAAFARQAAPYRITPVLSAAFESGVGLRMLVALAAALGDRDVPAGLDTYRRLSADVLAPRLAIDGPSVDVDALFDGDADVDLATLNRL